MNPKRFAGIALTVIILLLVAAGIRLALSRNTSAAEAPRVPPEQPAAQVQPAPAVDANPAPAAAPAVRTTHTADLAATEPATSAGATTKQTFNLLAGWNAIYLEVEPINTSPLVNIAPPNEDPVMVHEKSTMETVFGGLQCSNCSNCNKCLESVWTWNTPTSQIDYIIDPSEGLWDAPGWKRYIPEWNVGPDGNSRAFLTDLANLHANTAYLVKLTAAATLQVEGTPVVEDHRWVKGSYNLTGFPILPGMGTHPTVDEFLLVSTPPNPTAPPITEIRELNTNGAWGAKMAGGDTLKPGAAYLVYYDEPGAGDQDPKANFTAPLHIMDPVSDGLAFTRGAAGTQHNLRIENLSAIPARVDLSLTQPSGAGVALHITDPISKSLESAVQVDLEAHGAEVLQLSLSAAEQTGDGEALLEISSADLGTRWLLPVRAEKGSLAGLWVGDVVVNDVSEGRLGTTDVAGGLLTIALRPRESSGITGKAELHETISGNTSSVAVTLTLALPESEIIAPTVRTGTGLYLRGYVFADTNQNGERDGDEPGFAGRTVTATRLGGGTRWTTTGADGGYLLQDLDAGNYWLELDQQPPTGYTDNFSITPPATETGQPAPPQAPGVSPNIWPESVILGDDGVTQVVYRTFAQERITRTDFPRYDATDQRVEPTLNFGYVSTYEAFLYTGVCNDRLVKVLPLGDVLNGVLVTEIPKAALNPDRGVVDYQLMGGPAAYLIAVHGPGDVGAACGEIVVGAPTKFADGRGSAFTFRLILRVNEENRAAIVPYYAITSTQRVSSANFSITEPFTATNATFGDTSKLLDYLIIIAPEDPLNPYKHKYQPDHDNLDAKFNPMNLDAVDPWLWESYEVTRHISLELTELPPAKDATPEDAVKLDWGGQTYGGLYTEVIKGIHMNDITVKGFFVIRQVLAGEELIAQDYDK